MKKLNIISDNTNVEGIDLTRFIKERRLLKTKIKLIHIYLLDQDLITLAKNNLTINNLKLEDLYLTSDQCLIAPIKDKIIPFKPTDLKLISYLIYLSYLYNIDFITIFDQDPYNLWTIISKLHLSPNIKKNLFYLITANKGAYFSTFMEELNNPEYRNNLKEDALTLTRECKPAKKELILF